MQAVILAAGMGKRLKELTKNNTKCMVKVNGVTLIERMLRQIERQKVSRIIIVVGYEGQKLIDYIGTLNIDTPVTFIDNPIYDKTNNIYSLYLARDWLCKEDTLLFESDLIIEDSALDDLVNDPRETLALVDKYEPWMDGTCLKLNENDEIIDFVPGKRLDFNELDEYYKTVNIYKFSKDFSTYHYVPFLEAYQTALGRNEYYEQVLKVIAMIDGPVIRARRLTGEKWYEIDDIQDLDIAESLFAPDDDLRVHLMMARYGGYWRYPKLLDFCYLVNPYFPPQRLKDELRSNFDVLLTEYPSGMKVNSLLAAKNFGVRQENIVVGNGAAELIKSLMERLEGNTGFVRPTFEEYPNRYGRDESVNYIPINRDFSYTADDIMGFFGSTDISNLIIVNPDNPSGNYIPKKDILKLAEWSKRKGLTLIIDESFVDFADEEDSSIIDQDILMDNPHLFVMKSISKSYGVPGIRLGILASGNTEIIDYIKKDVAIWNINSMGEYYMQIAEKYKSDYASALVQIRAERARFQKALAGIEGIRVIPSQANYVMVELTGGVRPHELVKRLLIKYDILIKDLRGKTGGNYLRLAVRNTEDNDRLIEALKQELNSIKEVASK
ncbi:MAG: aminotransferase class I/II-fold pyridoxal phosphate-dependent enzyme [Clostridiales bacterium]|nr:aminotransferase class I/II-fold pyridoxal phosphate-dependent enzyme [Clostridiales bacterium]